MSQFYRGRRLGGHRNRTDPIYPHLPPVLIWLLPFRLVLSDFGEDLGIPATAAWHAYDWQPARSPFGFVAGLRRTPTSFPFEQPVGWRLFGIMTLSTPSPSS